MTDSLNISNPHWPSFVEAIVDNSKYKTKKEFCKVHGINQRTLETWLAGTYTPNKVAAKKLFGIAASQQLKYDRNKLLIGTIAIDTTLIRLREAIYADNKIELCNVMLCLGTKVAYVCDSVLKPLMPVVSIKTLYANFPSKTVVDISLAKFKGTICGVILSHDETGAVVTMEVRVHRDGVMQYQTSALLSDNNVVSSIYNLSKHLNKLCRIK